MDFYMQYLMEQYKCARGLKDLNINYNDCQKDFEKWLKQYKINCENYASLLFSSEINFINQNSAEVNKGNLDSAVLPYETTIISPYIERVRDNVIKSEFSIRRGLPQYNNFNGNIHRYMTHNPYSKFDDMDLMNWKYMHEFTEYEIVMGMFGSFSDVDREEKMRTLEYIKRSCSTPFIEQYDTFKDNYFWVLASRPKKRIK